MSCKLLKENLSDKDILKLKDDLFIEGVEDEYGPAKTLDCWGESKSSFYIPLYYYTQNYDVVKKTYPKTDFMMKISTFKTEKQKEVYYEALELLKKNKVALLSLHTNFGKSFLGIKLAHKSGFKTGVLVHRTTLADQWKESIDRFTTAKAQIISTGENLDPSKDFYIFNIAYVGKYYDGEKKNWVRKKFSQSELIQLGTLIVDEAHIACADQMAKALQYFEPKYSIGLTATPNRKDGLDKLLDLYFGSERVIRISDSPFTVYKYQTGIKPVFGVNAFGKKKWGDVVEYLSVSEERNKMIAKLVEKHPEKTIMIMCKLTKHCEILAGMLKKESVTVMKGSDRTYDKKARILISTFSKLGVGFDDQRLDMLILTSSVKEVEQYAGRLRHTHGKDRIIYDLVDEDHSCHKHWMERKKWYESRNGTIKFIKKEQETVYKRLVKQK